MLTVMLAAVALLADAAPAASKAPAPAATAAAPAKTNSDVFCRKEAVLGTNIPKKVCYSKAEYDANRKESRETVEHMQATAPLAISR